jgi:DNA-binding transcriptional MocR family regulator
LAEVFAELDPTHALYGVDAKLPALVSESERRFAADRITGGIAVTGGALDAIERALQTKLRPGDRVVVEDPTWPRIPDLVHALGLVIEPVLIDHLGLDPDRLARALRSGARAVIFTPRGQNPTGAAVDGTRGKALRTLLSKYPEVLVIEDDYLSLVSGASYVPVHGTTESWVVIRSLSKTLGPDLRIAVVAGDQLTISRIEGRQRLGTGWISHILQQVAALILARTDSDRLFARASDLYSQRRQNLIDSLDDRGVVAMGESGLGVWVPVTDEAGTVQNLLLQGWSVGPGERFRFNSPPGIRITTADVGAAEAERLAEAIAALTRMSSARYSA